MKKILILMLLMDSTNVFANDNTFLCIADKATGFHFSKQTKLWGSQNFNVADAKYILKKTNSSWEWKEFGAEISYTICGNLDEYGLNCNNGLTEVIFNRKKLRYQKIYVVGYISNTNDGDDDPSIEIGRCSPM